MNDRQQHRLLTDQRGAIVVMGVFMSSFLVGGLWYVMGIAEAAIYRQTVQAGADSTAFTAAVYHARGMNILAMVNIVIGAVMAISAAAAMLAQVAALVLSVAKTMCDMSQQPPYQTADGTTIDYSNLEFACDKIEPARDLMTMMQGVIAQVNQDTDGMLASLSMAQIEVAETSPWLGSAQGAAIAGMHAPYLTAGGAGSPSMVPVGDRQGLPVQNEPFERACDRGSIIVGKLVTLLVPDVLDPILEYANIDVMNNLPSRICRGNGAGGGQQWDFFNKDDVCEDYKDKGGNGNKDDDDEDDDKKNEAFDQCKKDAEDNKHNTDNVDLPAAIDPEDKSTKGMFAPARNGNDYMQVYSVVRGNVPFIERSDGGLEVASHKTASPTAPGQHHEDIGVAQAEFYYDQTAQALAEDSCWIPCPAGMNWPSYKENALWNLRWRARLRRYRVPQNVDPNVLTNAIPDLADVGYSDGLGTFNGGVGMASTLLSESKVAGTTGEGNFIGSGSETIH